MNEWSTNNCYLKQIDRYNEFCINCMITPGSKLIFILGMRFLFIHEGKSEDTIKNFFQDCYEFYVKV